MQRITWSSLFGWLPVVAVVCMPILSHSFVAAAVVVDEEESEVGAERAYSRYLQLLKRNPQAGVSLDRVYGHHIDRGTLDNFIEGLTADVAAGDADGSNAMILGLMESRRGRDIAAKEAFEAAEQKRPEDPMVSWYLGQSLVAVGETDAATAALERSLSREIPRAIQEQVFQMLGRIYQRGEETTKAIALWKRFEAAFPDDDRVQEQIASIQIEENDLEDALARYEAIAAKSADPYKRVQFGVKAADLKLKLGQVEDGLAAFETLLEELRPSSWMFNDVRDRIEQSYLRTDDYAGLVEYYEKWIVSHPDDIDAMSRMAKHLAVQGRSDAAEEWYAKAIEKAPSDPKLRLAFIEQLIGEKKYADAIRQYEQLATIDRGNPDHIERWGMLYLRHPDLDEAEQRKKAGQIWSQLTDGKPNDAVAISRVADLFRSARMTDDAIALYEKAVELEPQNPQYREYLGEYLHTLKRTDEAKVVWQAMVEGNQRTTQNLARLSEVYKSFGYTEEALVTLEAACELDPEFGDLIRFNNMLREAGRFDDSLKQLERVSKLAASADETQIILEARLKTLAASGRLANETTALEREVAANPSAEQWRILAFYQEAMNRLPDASRSARKAVDLEPDSIPAWAVAARVMENAGLLAESSDANRTLAGLDRRFRTQYLKKIAELERRLGRMDNALQAAKDVIQSAPGNPDSYRFYSDLCFQLGKPDLGLDALRRSVRVNPSDVESLTGLAKALAEQFKTEEAIELYWRAFQKAEKLDGKIAVVQTLTELYIRTNSFDKLVTRLENLGKELSQQRDMVICLANAYQATGDIGLARDALKGLLKDGSRDVILLDELALLAEQANEFDEAIDYQKQIVQLANSEESRGQLASLLLRSGDIEAAETLWAQSSGVNSEPQQQIESIDELIKAGKFETARKLADMLLVQSSNDWEALLRLAVIDWKEDKAVDVISRCEQILAMSEPLDSPAHRRQLNRTNRNPSSTSNSTPRSLGQSLDSTRRLAVISSIANEMGLAKLRTVPTGSAPWAVADFGECRVAAISLRMGLALDRPDFLNQFKTKAQAAGVQDTVAAWDWWYALSFMQNITGASDDAANLQVAEILAQSPDPEGKLILLATLNGRANRPSVPPGETSPQLKALNNKQIALMLNAWEVVSVNHPDWDQYTGGIRTIFRELRRSNLHHKVTELYTKLVREDASARELYSALQISEVERDIDQTLQLIERLARLQQANPSAAGSTNILSQLGGLFAAQTTRLVEQNDWDSVAKLIAKFIDIKSSTFNPLASSVVRNRGSVMRPSATIKTGSLSQNLQLQSVGAVEQINLIGPSRYYSADDLKFFTAVHSIYAGRPSGELVKILSDYRSAATGIQIVFAELALANVESQGGNREQAAVHLVRAAAEVPDDSTLRMSLVQYYQQRRNNAEALQLLDTIDAADQLLLKDRELLALQLATQTGNKERSREAAERLFGMRLDSDTALQLSSTMESLGMKEMAASLLARTRKVAGNNLGTLLALMQKYQSAGDTDVATQIAHQILRQTNGRSVSRTNQTSPEMARNAAVAVLGKSGQLESIIRTTVEQLSRSPKSVRLHQTLLEYYSASGRSKEAAQIAKTLESLVPVTADSLLREGQQLESGRRYSEACDKYLAAFKLDPQKFSQNYFQYLRTFQSAKRLNELADLLLENDGLKNMQNNYQVVMQLVESLFQEATRTGKQTSSPSRLKGMELFRAAWIEFPTYRSAMIANIRDANAWQEPEMVEYAKEGLIPKTLQQSIATPWQGIAESLSYLGNSDVIATLTRIRISLSRDPQRRKEYITEVANAVNKFDKWHGGKVLLGSLLADAGDLDEAYELFETLERDPEVLFIPTNVSWVISSELARFKEPRFTELSIRLLKTSLTKDNSASKVRSPAMSPERRLAMLYSQNGETENARLALRQCMDNMDFSQYSGMPGYKEYMSLQNYNSIAEEFLQIGCPFDAIEFYQKINPELLAAMGRYASDSSVTQLLAIAKAGEKKAMAAITPESVLALLQRKQEQQADRIDLLLVPPEQNEPSTRIRSLVLEGMSGLNRKEDVAQLTEILQQVLNESDASTPWSAIAAIEFGVATNDSNLMNAGLEKLKEYTQQTAPAEADNLSEIGLWITARSTLNTQHYREFAEVLADRAQAAAEANSDDRWLISMMKEKGEIAIAAGNRDQAEQAWSRLLDAVLADNSANSSAEDPAANQRSNPSPKAESALDELRKRLLSKPTTVTP